MAGVHWNEKNLPNPETTTGAQAKADQALAAAKAYTDQNKVTSLPWGSITGKPSTFPPSSHTHSWGDITGKPSTFPPSGHNHDDRYYTKSQVDGMLGGIGGGSEVVVATGTVNDGGTIPLPSGYTQAQCRWMVSPAGYYVRQGSGSDSQQAERLVCTVDNNRKVSVYATIRGSSYTWSSTANYIIIGVK